MATQWPSMHRADYNGKQGLAAVLNVLCLKQTEQHLPSELFDEIWYAMHPELFRRLLANRAARMQLLDTHPALTPASDGSCYLLGLDRWGQLLPNGGFPTELRKLIFTHLLPDKHIVAEPACADAGNMRRNPMARPKRNTTNDLMTLNKQIMEEIKVCVYEERVCEVHVHEGLFEGGIEFLDAGRQPLHYKNDETDMRFPRFCIADEFGFSLMKKIKVIIFPNRTEGYAHIPYITYFMIHSLARELERKEDKEIVSITVDFAVPKQPQGPLEGRRQIMNADNPWWDVKKDEPKASSIHNLSDVELLLRPFGILKNVHNVHINLPKLVCDHEPSVQFVKDLTSHMKSDSPFGMHVSDKLEMQGEMIRVEVEDYIFRIMHGHKEIEYPFMSESDMAEESHYDFGTEPISDDEQDANRNDTSDWFRVEPYKRQKMTSHGQAKESNFESYERQGMVTRSRTREDAELLHKEIDGVFPSTHARGQAASPTTGMPPPTTPRPGEGHPTGTSPAPHTSSSGPARMLNIAGTPSNASGGSPLHLLGSIPHPHVFFKQCFGNQIYPDALRRCNTCGIPLPPLHAEDQTHHCLPGLGALASPTAVRAISREPSGSSQLGTTQLGELSLQGAGAPSHDREDVSEEFVSFSDDEAH